MFKCEGFIFLKHNLTILTFSFKFLGQCVIFTYVEDFIFLKHNLITFTFLLKPLEECVFLNMKIWYFSKASKFDIFSKTPWGICFARSAFSKTFVILSTWVFKMHQTTWSRAFIWRWKGVYAVTVSAGRRSQKDIFFNFYLIEGINRP